MMYISTLNYSAFMPRHDAIISSSKIREFLVPLHNVSNVDAVWEQLYVLLPRVIIVPQPFPKPSNAIETEGLISVPCKEMKDR